MEVRSRNFSVNDAKQNLLDSKDKNEKSQFCSKITRELKELLRVAGRLFKGRGSNLGYLFIPAFISLLWLFIAFSTNKKPALSLEERLNEQYLKEFFEPKTLDEGLLNVETTHHEHIDLPEGETVNVVMAMPFLDFNPLGATEYIQSLEWIFIYSTVPITLHVITNTDSVPYVNQIFDKLNATSNVEFHTDILTLADIMEKMTEDVCPKMTVSEEFCDILMGKMTPLLFPYLFPNLDHAIYVDRQMVFQDDIGYLYQKLQELKKSKAGLAMSPEQTNTYMRAFAGWQRINPSTKLGRAPPEGKPGYNPDLILMDLEKLRASASYRTYFSEIRLHKLVKQYLFHSSSDLPSLGDVVNLMAADNENLFTNLGCEWNRNSKPSSDVLEKQFNVCPNVHHIRAWNGNPRTDRVHQEKDKNISVGRRKLDPEEHPEIYEEFLAKRK